MFKLLPLIAVLFPLSAQTSGIDPQIVVSTLPEDMAASVFLGADSEMPIARDYELAIEVPTRFVRRPPESIEDALDWMRQVLPRWYLSAVFSSQGEDECSVIVNGASYSVTVSNWLWSYWGMDDDESGLRKVFARMDIYSPGIIQQALSSGLCIDLKDGRQEAIEEINKYRP